METLKTKVLYDIDHSVNITWFSLFRFGPWGIISFIMYLIS